MPINDMSSIVGLATSSIPAERAALKRSTRAVAAPTNPVWSRAEQFDRLGAAYEFIHAKGGKAFTLRLATDDLIPALPTPSARWQGACSAPLHVPVSPCRR
jgi:hypothetical protein